jgi:phage gp29-like protein
MIRRLDQQNSIGPNSVEGLRTRRGLNENLAREILEKDWDAAAHNQTRVAAVRGTEWTLTPPKGLDKNPRAVAIAEAAMAMLGGIDSKVHDLIGHCMTALLPGYAVAEIMWSAGGRGIDSFEAVDTGMVTFDKSLEPKLVTREMSQGVPLVPGKFVWHQVNSLGGDPTRGHLIRTVSRLFLLKNTGIKDLARMIEKFGMPFVVGRVDQAAWDKDRSLLAHLIRNFGSDGGGLFSKGVEIEMLQAAQTDGEIFFRLLEYTGAAMAKVFLGQTATSGDGAGLNNGGAQTLVRRDILEGDCRAVEISITRSILEPWTLWNYGADAPVPQFSFELVDPVDVESISKAAESVSKFGYRPTMEAMSKLLGMDLEAMPAAASPALTLADKTGPSNQEALGTITEAAVRKLGGAAVKWMAPLQEAIEEALAGLPDEPDATDEKEFRKRLADLLQGLPGLLEEMDSREVEDVLAGAMFAADANGRLAALERITARVKS